METKMIRLIGYIIIGIMTEANLVMVAMEMVG
jgi:hypothetical protein